MTWWKKESMLLSKLWMPMNRSVTYLLSAFPSCSYSPNVLFWKREKKQVQTILCAYVLRKNKTSKQNIISCMIKKCKFAQWILLLKICGFHSELICQLFSSSFHGKSVENLIIIMAKFLSLVAINDCLHRKANSLHYTLPFLHQLRKAFLN